jgi:hypothetical protein
MACLCLPATLRSRLHSYEIILHCVLEHTNILCYSPYTVLQWMSGLNAGYKSCPTTRHVQEIQLLLILDIKWGKVVSVTPRPRFTPGKRTPGTHCTGGWVGPRAGLDKEAGGIIEI